jgi:hypothetical protein
MRRSRSPSSSRNEDEGRRRQGRRRRRRLCVFERTRAAGIAMGKGTRLWERSAHAAAAPTRQRHRIARVTHLKGLASWCIGCAEPSPGIWRLRGGVATALATEHPVVDGGRQTDFGGWFREGSWCGGGTHKHRAIIKMERLGVLGSGDVELSILFIGDGECLCARWQPRAFLARRT